MKGVAVALMLVLAVAVISLAAATAPIKEKLQGGDYCNNLKIAGTGTIDIANSVVDRTIGLEYYNIMTGDGDIEMNSMNGASDNAGTLHANLDGNNATPLNLLDNVQMTYSGKTPLTGVKFIKSDAFWGGIGAEIKESFSVTEMDKSQTTYFASTNPASYITDPEKIAEALKMKSSPVHAVAMQTKMSFNGTWVTDAQWHQIFYKDVKIHEAFTGNFEVDKLLKFHDNPVPEQRSTACDGIDC